MKFLNATLTILFIVFLGLVIYSKLINNETSYVFYSEEADATCINAKEDGEWRMHCLPGNRIQGAAQ